MDLEAFSTEVLGGLAGGLLAAFAGALLFRFGRRVVWLILGASVVVSVALGVMAFQTRDNGYTVAAALVLLGGLIGGATVLLRPDAGEADRPSSRARRSRR
ncbi:hypothetical protein [Myceligenerans salitolerans]|uniref:Major facilitator superfamily (MFS) profile domain-containing protein n=1 Tax=Myceligenerans salitolerans TaxID=1230528 RepID=A0ABS3I887_9MICO|nr:hypothetical protein [Myceligenerans salitolerans]MBO0609214.1 hypothetical protein [Myceligenerans salitolerans]